MIYPYFSNSYAFLKALLIEQIREARSAGGFAQAFALTEIVIADEAVKDDLSRALADALGVASGVRFTTTQAWLDRMNYGSLDVRGRARALEWAIYAVVTDEAFLSKPECGRLRKYVEAMPQSALWPLASRLAALFSTYFSYRADWLWSWAGVKVPSADRTRELRESKVLQAHPDYVWQKALWLELCERKNDDDAPLWPTARDFLSIPRRWLERMNGKERKGAQPLYIFVPRELPPLALPQLLAEGRRRDVYLYVDNPSSAFWFDPTVGGSDGFSWFHRNATMRRALLDRLHNFVTQDVPGDETVFLEDDLPESDVRAPQTRTIEMQALGDILRLKARAEQTEDIFVRPRGMNFLAAIQTAVLEDDPRRLPRDADDGDDSFLIVRAPNAVREVQALCDWIAATIEASRAAGSPLTADDFLVTTPDIDAMAGVIAAVMSSRTDEESLNYHIAGQSELEINGAARAMLAAMRFVGGAATASEFSELIEMPAFAAVRPQYEINATRIGSWLAAAGYRWGLNEKHAQSALDRHLAAAEGNGPLEGTLERALERLLAGNLTGDNDNLIAGDVLGVSGTELSGLDGTEKDAGSFEFLLSLAQTFSDVGEMPQRQSVRQWLETTRRFADRLFAGYARSSEMIAFMLRASALAASAQEVMQESEIAFETWCAALERTLRNTKTASRASGRITFARTGDFVGMPFKCVAVIGLNDGEAFPGSSRREEFDLTAARLIENGKELNVARRGDRDARESNRGVFLELLLAASEHFYVSYSIGSGAVPNNPSIVLQDLKQALAEGLNDPSVLDVKLTKTVAALAASAENFSAGLGALRSRSSALEQAVNKAIDSGYIADEAPFADAPIALHDEASLSVDDLAKFFSYAEAKSLKLLGLATDSDEPAQTTPIMRLGNDDYLFRSRVRRRIYQALRQGKTIEEISALGACDPALGEQSVRTLLLEQEIQNLSQVYECVQQTLESVRDRTSLRLKAGRVRMASAAGQPFQALAVPAVECEAGADGNLLVADGGVSSSEYLRHFLQFAAVNLLAAERKISSVDYVYVSKSKDKLLQTHWSVAARGKREEALDELSDMLAALLELVNIHVGRRPILCGQFVSEQDSLVWRGTNGFAAAQSGTQALVSAAEALAATFDVNAKAKKSRKKTDPREEFDRAHENLVALLKQQA